MFRRFGRHLLIHFVLVFPLLEQRVNPKLTMPYWDFTIEELEAENSGDDDELILNPPLFQESWFGTADPVDNTVSANCFFTKLKCFAVGVVIVRMNVTRMDTNSG